MSVKNQNATLPVLSQLKAEVQAKRDEMKNGGKPAKNSVAMKEVARKYGFTSWEKLHAASLKQAGSEPGSASIVVLTVDEHDHAVIVNREIILDSSDFLDSKPMFKAARKLAMVLGAQLSRSSVSTEDIRINGEMLDVTQLTFEHVAAALNLIDPIADESNEDVDLPSSLASARTETLADYAKAAGFNVIGEEGDYEYAKVDGIDAQFPEWHGGFETIDQAWSAAAGAAYQAQHGTHGRSTVKVPGSMHAAERNETHEAAEEAARHVAEHDAYELAKEMAQHVAGYRGGEAPHIKFEVTAFSEANPDPKKGSIDLVVEVTLEVFARSSPHVTYAFWRCIGDKKINGYDPMLEHFTPLAQETAQGIVEDLYRVGIEVDLEQFVDSMMS